MAEKAEEKITRSVEMPKSTAKMLTALAMVEGGVSGSAMLRLLVVRAHAAKFGEGAP